MRHWIGAFHAIARTLLLVAGWFLFPDHQYVVAPAIIVAIYAVTILVLEVRWRRMTGAGIAQPA